MKKYLLLTAVVAGMTFGACDSYLDINQDPNAPSDDEVTASVVLPAAEMNLASSYGDYLRIVGGYFAQHYAQIFGTSNYLDYSRFTMSATRSSGAYTQLNQRAIANFQTAIEKAAEENQYGTILAATTLRAFTYQVLVDCYGEVPFSESLQGIDNLSPKYDDGQDIYDALLAELDEALAGVSGSESVATNFLFPNKSASSWIQFANALKLKMLMRMADVEDVRSRVASLIAENNFPAGDVAYEGCWSNASGSMSPFYAEEFSTAWGSTQKNVIANLAIVGTMQQDEYVDPRLSVFFSVNNARAYVGGVSGTNYAGSSALTASHWCRPVASYDMPVYLITRAETEFFIAEYYARYGTADEAEAHYNAAIEASFATAGVSGAAENIAMFPYDAANYKKCIGIAKWVALAGVNNFEAWCEVRRLDYPAFGTLQGSDFYHDDSVDASIYVPGTLYTPIQVFAQVGNNKLLERFPYAESSSARNTNTPEFPGYTTPVFWGK